MRFDIGTERLVPRWVVVFFVGGAVVLIPWIVLMFTVPQVVNVSQRWELLWGGFDCFLVLGFAVTAFRLITRSPRGAVTAAMTGTMLLVDAWFDVLTTHRGGQIISLLMAVFAEIPCALICFYVSRRIVGLFEQAKDYLAGAGFHVSGGRLVPPVDFPDSVAGPAEPLPRVGAASYPAAVVPPPGRIASVGVLGERAGRAVPARADEESERTGTVSAFPLSARLPADADPPARAFEAPGTSTASAA